jgi:XTP/dITP diphosphohydrolase
MIRNSSPLEILVATRNPGKIREMHEALRPSQIELRYLHEFPDVTSVDEVGRTYEENAILKALGYSKQTGICALADDSGLEVDALGGMPGVVSARFAGHRASDHERIEKLLAAISECPYQARTARFVCCMALAGWQPDKNSDRGEPSLLSVTEGKCEGVIATAPRGALGFGFDPVFVPGGYSETFSELPAQVKNSISHRALALVAMRDFLSHWIAQT